MVPIRNSLLAKMETLADIAGGHKEFGAAVVVAAEEGLAALPDSLSGS